MKTEYYIAKKLLKEGFDSRISKPIIGLSKLAVAIGLAVMILSLSVAIGFQTEVRNKVLGFGSHVQLFPIQSQDNIESERVNRSPYWMNDLNDDERVKNIYAVAYKPAILQSRSVTGVNKEGEEYRDVDGVICKGIGQDFDFQFLKDNWVSGKIPKFGTSKKNDSVVISESTANGLQLALGDKVTAFFVNQSGPRQRNLIVSGIYNTGLIEFDKQFVFTDINQIENINKWNTKTSLNVLDSCIRGVTFLVANTKGGSGDFEYSWGSEQYGFSSFTQQYRIPFCLERDTSIKVIARERQTSNLLIPDPELYDTAEINIKVLNKGSSCYCQDSSGKWVKELVDEGWKYELVDKSILVINESSKQSFGNFAGGFEVVLNKFEDLEGATRWIGYDTENTMKVTDIIERNEEMFNWLNMLDLNVYLILSLMTLVAIINMTSALLVIILERTRMIGVLKAMGARNWQVRKIFLIYSGRLVVSGLIWGNIVAFGLILLQSQFGIFKLDPANYYLSEVPMHFIWGGFLLINVGSFLACIIAMIIPSFVITKISPVRAIKVE